MNVGDDLIRALYNVPAYRGSRTGGERGKWWTSSPEEASSYTKGPVNDPSKEARVVIPAQLNTEGFAHVEASGKYYDQIDSTKLPPKIASQIRRIYGRLPKLVTTDQVASAVEALGLPGASITSVLDQAERPAAQYFVNDPTRKRSRFAKFQDPNSEDIMAGLLLSLMGAGAASQTQQGPDSNA